jgi:hypothetical protein
LRQKAGFLNQLGLKGKLGADPPVTESLQSYFDDFGRSKIRIEIEAVLMSRAWMKTGCSGR